MGKVFWILPILVGAVILSCSEKESDNSTKTATNPPKTEETAPSKAAGLNLEQANRKLSNSFLYTGKLSIKNGTAILEIWNPLQAKTVQPSTILEGLYKTLKVYCDATITAPKLDLKVYYNLNGNRELLFEAKAYRNICNTVKNTEKQQIPDAVKGAIILNGLRNADIKVGNKEWIAEFCRDKRVKLFCSHIGF